MDHAALRDVKAQPGLSQYDGEAGSLLKGPPSSPLPSPGPWGVAVTSPEPFKEAHYAPGLLASGRAGLHMEVICSWERICQRGCRTRLGVKIAQPGPAEP